MGHPATTREVRPPHGHSSWPLRRTTHRPKRVVRPTGTPVAAQADDPQAPGAGRRARRCYSSARRVAAAAAMARIFPSALARGRYFIPQSVAIVIVSGEA